MVVNVSGQPHRLKKFNYLDESFWYVVDDPSDSRAKIFLPSSKPMPDSHVVAGVGPDSLDSSIEWTMQMEGDSSALPIANTFLAAGRPFEALEDVADLAPAAGAQDFWKPGDAIERHHLLSAYRFIYADDLSQALLEAFLRDEADGVAELSLENVLGDHDVDNTVGGGYQIEIEHNDSDMNPALAASYFHHELISEVIGYYSFKQHLQDVLDDLDLHDGWGVVGELEAQVQQYWTKARAEIGAETAVIAGECYMAAIGIVNEGADWIMVIGDIGEGHYTSLAAMLPFIPRGLVQTGRRLSVRTRSGQVVHQFDASELDAIRELYRVNDLRVMGTIMDEAELTTSLRRLLAGNGGRIPVPTNRNGLKNRMLDIGPAPSWGRSVRGPSGKQQITARAHHDFPWKEREWFAEHGIDVNDPAFGRWVSETDHVQFHNATTPKYNDFWDQFISKEDPNNPYTIGQILDELLKAREKYRVTNGN